jgi:putative PIN family toxin of toxin-antitoxin system
VRVVLDTNVVVSALLFSEGRLAWLREGWRDRFVPLIDRPCAEELVRVLGYPKFRLGREDVSSLLEDYLPYAETIRTSESRIRGVPRCRDDHDRKFLVLAVAGSASVLVSGDAALLELNGRTGFVIENPTAFRARLGMGLDPTGGVY